ncbi:MAG: PDZ domain-containing protein [Planctomycetota bacterium]|nr:PDZ domain-containing protein [Planctomycetota bacterium]
MKSGAGLLLILGLALISGAVLFVDLVSAQEDAREAGDSAVAEARIDQLIGQLGDEDPKVRDNATRELLKLGKPALTKLRSATKNTDAEVVWRAEQLISDIESGKTAEAEANARADAEASANAEAGGRIRIVPGGRVQIFTKSHSIGRDANEAIERTQTADGKVTVKITRRDKNGAEKVETYSADSPEEFARKYPEIDKKTGSSISITIHDGSGRPGDLDEEWKKEQERVDEMLKKFMGEDFIRRPDDFVKRIERILPIDEMIKRILEREFGRSPDEMSKQLEESRRRLDRILKGLRRHEDSQEEWEADEDSDSDSESVEDVIRESQRRLDEMLDGFRHWGGEGNDSSDSKPRTPTAPGEDQQGKGDEPVTDPAGRGGDAEDAAQWTFGAEAGFIDTALRSQLDLPEGEGVIIHSVTPGSEAEKAGFKQYDIVVSINSRKVQSKWDFRRLMLDAIKKGNAEVSIVRRGEPITLKVPGGQETQEEKN